MDVIVTDHHEIEGEPPACIVISPKLGSYPCSDLAGVGVAFKLAHALLSEPEEDLVEIPLALRAYTDVVAVGTIADVVPLAGENRVLARVGLGRLRSAPRPGLATLLEVAGGRPGVVDAGTVGFRLAPRLNAAGRLEDATQALELLGCEDRDAALPVALRLDELNRERQAIEAAMLAEACALVPEPLPPALVLSSPAWHEGVIGIVASRVAERFNRPVILLSEGDEEARGSGRGILGFDLLGAVERSAAHLLTYGGHRAACGLRLRREHIGAFREQFTAAAAAALSADDLMRALSVDAVVGCDELTLELADELELLAPHGLGNRRVTLLVHGAEVVAPRLTRNKKHMQYRIRRDGFSCRAIHFNFGQLREVDGPGRYDVPVTLSKNEYNGCVSAQVAVKTLFPLAEPAVDLCPASCSTACADRLRGDAVWEELLQFRLEPTAGVEERLERARREGRVRDRRGRTATATITSLAAGGERVLVLVADVARRRPLLSRGALSPHMGRTAMYLQAACVGRLGVAAESDIVMTSYDVVAARPEVAAGFTHMVLFDPPSSRAALALVASAAPEAWLHAAWGSAEAAFAAQVGAGELDLYATLRRVWRCLAAAPGEFNDDLAGRLLDDGDGLRSVSAAGAALWALREAGLLVVDQADRYHLERPESKVDITTTEAYGAWHRLFQRRDLLKICLTARL